ncbi:zinc finger MYM-type protein 4-like isoform X1 [Gordionus sp. m RMFG-2023]|uniref:zinc finger MYM-type protein 4-like isoform X1 n=1 Tax=Gordionus sp. m RMFG-2023 TaxID=3053472 RepID=UPI0031FBF458
MDKANELNDGYSFLDEINKSNSIEITKNAIESTLNNEMMESFLSSASFNSTEYNAKSFTNFFQPESMKHSTHNSEPISGYQNHISETIPLRPPSIDTIIDTAVNLNHIPTTHYETIIDDTQTLANDQFKKNNLVEMNNIFSQNDSILGSILISNTSSDENVDINIANSTQDLPLNNMHNAETSTDSDIIGINGDLTSQIHTQVLAVNTQNMVIKEPCIDSSRDFKKHCLFCYSLMEDFLSHLYISGDTSKPICPKHLPCQAVSVVIPSCVECGKRLTNGRMIILDSNLDFCSENCLHIFLPKLSINCFLCQKILTKEAFGQFCLKLENRNIRQFCGEICLEGFNPLANYCYQCHKDITHATTPPLEHIMQQNISFDPNLNNIENSQMEYFCDQNCLSTFQRRSHAGYFECSTCNVCHRPDQPILQCLVIPYNVATKRPSLAKLCGLACLNLFMSQNRATMNSGVNVNASNRLSSASKRGLEEGGRSMSNNALDGVNDNKEDKRSHENYDVDTHDKATKSAEPRNENSCEFCGASLLGRSTMTALTVDSKTRFFCGAKCAQCYKEEEREKMVKPGERHTNNNNKTLTECYWCKGLRFTRDMVCIKGLSENEDVTNHFCTQNCVALYKLSKGDLREELGGGMEYDDMGADNSSSRLRMIQCDNCSKNFTKATDFCQFYVSEKESEDGLKKQFCSFPCMAHYKIALGKRQQDKEKNGQQQALLSGNNSTGMKGPSLHQYHPNSANDKDENTKKLPVKNRTNLHRNVSSLLTRNNQIDIDHLRYTSTSNPSSFRVLLDILKKTGLSGGYNGPGQNGPVWPVPPCDVKNKSTSIKPLVRSQGTSTDKFTPLSKTDRECQTDDIKPRFLPIPIPVPFYIPFPLHMYTSFTPVPIAIPVPILVPAFIPTTYNTGEDICKYMKTVKDKVPSDPLQAELLMIAQMVADNDLVNPEAQFVPDRVRLKPLKGSVGFKEPPVTYSEPNTDDINGSFVNNNHNKTHQSNMVQTNSNINATGVQMSQQDEVYQMAIQFDSLANGEVTTAIPIQNADGSITYATIDPSTGTLTPIDPALLQQHLQSLQNMQNFNLQQQGVNQSHQHRESLADQSQSNDRTTNELDTLDGNEVGAIDYSPPYTFSLQEQQQQVQSSSPNTGNVKHLEPAFGVGAFKSWARLRNNETIANLNLNNLDLAIEQNGELMKEDPLYLNTEDLINALAIFVREIKKPSQEDYTSDSIYYFCLGIQAYIYENGRSENVFTDTLYGIFTDALNEVLLRFEPQITTEGMLLSRIDEECLWESMQLGAHSPHVLLNTLLYFNTKYFHLTTLEAHLSLSFQHVVKCLKENKTSTRPSTDDQDEENSEGKGDFSNANADSAITKSVLRYYSQGKDDEEQNVSIYEQDENIQQPLKCPVRLYEFYLSKCPDEARRRNDIFYLLPETLCLPDSPLWYSNENLSPTILAKMFNRIFIVKETLESNITI